MPGNNLKNKVTAFFSTVMMSTWALPSGENKTTWDLMFDPFTRYMGDFFYLTIIMMVALLIYSRTDSLGPTLVWISVVSAVFGATSLTTGWGSILFAIIAAFAVAVAGLRAAVRRDMV